MSKRTNSFPTFKPTDMQLPPSDGFQPATIIMANQINSSNYMSYNFVNSFVNALIEGGGNDDSSIYTYDATNLKTLIKEDISSWVWNIITNSPTFDTVNIVDLAENSSILHSDSLNFNVTIGDEKYQTKYTYTLMDCTKKDSSDKLLSSVQVDWENLTYSFETDTTVSKTYISVDMMPSSLKESSETYNLHSTLAQVFYYSQSTTTMTNDLNNFLNQHQGLNFSSIVIKRHISATANYYDWIPITPVRRISDFGNFNYYYIDKSTGALTMTSSIESFYTGGDFSIIVTFC